MKRKQKRGYVALNSAPMMLGNESPILITSGEVGNKIEHIEAEVEDWNTASPISVPISDQTIEF